MPNVAFIRPELAKLLPQYYKIRDCIEGEEAIKREGTKYLPMLDPGNKSEDNKLYYRGYKERAVFFNVTRRTLNGLVGQVFMRDPIVKVPPVLDVVVDDATGGGMTLEQLCKKSLAMTLAYSRSGLFVDFPRTQGGVTVEERDSGKIRATITNYSPMSIINYRTDIDGAKEYLSLVVISESWISQDDGFEMKTSGQFRVLKMENGVYKQQIWREKFPGNYDANASKPLKGTFVVSEEFVVLGADGEPLDYIPFMFLGSDNNDVNPDNPNMYDLATLNIAHYRNSADYEQICFIVGQPTPVVSGVNKEWVEDILKGRLNFGASGGIMLPKDGKAELLQVNENTMAKEAMEMKERQMVALGAKLVEQKQVQRTAFETKVEATSEGSVLSTTTKNVQAGFLWALQQCAKFSGLDDGGVEFELNTDFDIARMTPEEVKQTIDTWQKGGISFKEMRDVLRKAGQATEDDATAKASIAKDTAEAMALAMPDNVPGASAFNPTKPKAPAAKPAKPATGAK